MEETNPFVELKITTPKNQGFKRNNPSETPSPGTDQATSKDPSKEQDAKKTRIDSEEAISREKRLSKANKEFLEGNVLIFEAIKLQEEKMMDAHSMSNSRKGSYNRADRETRFKQEMQRRQEEKRRQAKRETKIWNGIAPCPGVKEASYAGPLNDYGQFPGKLKDQNYHFEKDGELLIPQELRYDGVPPRLDEDGRMEEKTTRINETDNDVARDHRERFRRAEVAGKRISRDFLENAQKETQIRYDNMVKAGADPTLARIIMDEMLGWLDNTVKPYIAHSAAAQETMSDMITCVDQKVDMLSDDFSDFKEIAATKTEVCRMIQSESDKNNTILIKDTRFLEKINGASNAHKKKVIALQIVKEMLDYNRDEALDELDTRLVEYVKIAYPSQMDRKGPTKRGTLEIHFNPRKVSDCDAVTMLLKDLPDIAWAGQNKNKDIVDRMSEPVKKEYDDFKSRWEHWRDTKIGEIQVFKSVKSKLESKHFFELADKAHIGNMEEVRKIFPGKDGVNKMKRLNEGEFAEKFPCFLLAKRYNPHAYGPMIQKIKANSYHNQGEYMRLVIQSLERGEKWYERQTTWSEERTLAKEMKFEARNKKKKKTEDSSVEMPGGDLF